MKKAGLDHANRPPDQVYHATIKECVKNILYPRPFTYPLAQPLSLVLCDPSVLSSVLRSSLHGALTGFIILLAIDISLLPSVLVATTALC